MEKEEGEMSDGEDIKMHVDVDEDSKNTAKKNISSDISLLYKVDKSGLIVEALGKTDAAKLEERAERFGLNLAGNKLITQKQLDELYRNFGIESGNERHFRFDTLHIAGVDGLTTLEIFKYLEDYKPVSLEWVDEKSCNVVCQDHIAAALALLVHSREIRNVEVKDMLATVSTLHWREGMPHEKKDYIFMRFATNTDKKEPHKKKRERLIQRDNDQTTDQTMDPVGKNPWGDLCQSWGVYDHQEVLNHRPEVSDKRNYTNGTTLRTKNRNLAMRLGKRTAKYEDDSDSGSSMETRWESKVPRMRMRADDEESRLKRKREALYTQNLPEKIKIKSEDEDFAPLSIEVANTDSSYGPKEITKLSDKFKRQANNKANKKPDGVHSRLGAKVSIDNDNSSDESDVSDYNVMSRVEKVASKSELASNVWSRLEISIDNSKPEENVKKPSSDLRQRLKSTVKHKSKDVRQRLGKNTESLRIEVDNEFY